MPWPTAKIYDTIYFYVTLNDFNNTCNNQNYNYLKSKIILFLLMSLCLCMCVCVCVRMCVYVCVWWVLQYNFWQDLWNYKARTRIALDRRKFKKIFPNAKSKISYKQLSLNWMIFNKLSSMSNDQYTNMNTKL